MAKRAVLVMASVVALIALAAGSAFAQGAPTAMAELQDAEGNIVGSAEFVEGEGGVTITVNVTGGLEPGESAIHIHETGDITPDFSAAGGHFNPTGAEHGFDNPRGPHAGDLENIVIGEDGTASYRTVNDRITLSPGPLSIVDEDGSALIIHAMPDDYVTDDDPESGPGMSGDRVVGGVIVAGQAMPETGGINLLYVALAALVLLVGAGALAFWLLRRRA